MQVKASDLSLGCYDGLPEQLRCPWPAELFARLPEETLIHVLSCCGIRSLLRMAAVSKHLHMLARSESLWAQLLRLLWNPTEEEISTRENFFTIWDLPYQMLSCAKISYEFFPHYKRALWGNQPWCICSVSATAKDTTEFDDCETDGGIDFLEMARPWRCSSKHNATIERELSSRQSVKASLKCQLLQHGDEIVPMVDEDLTRHRWKVKYSSRMLRNLYQPHIDVSARRKGPAVFHPSYLDSTFEGPINRRNGTVEQVGDSPAPPAEYGFVQIRLPQPPWQTDKILYAQMIEMTCRDLLTTRLAIRKDDNGEWEVSDHDMTIVSTGLQPEKVHDCRATGIQSRPELNGKNCIVESYDATRGRYRVRFLSARQPGGPFPYPALQDNGRIEYPGEVIRLRPKNVVLPHMAAVVLVGLSGKEEVFNGRFGRVQLDETMKDTIGKDISNTMVVKLVEGGGGQEITCALENCLLRLGLNQSAQPLSRVAPTTSAPEPAAVDQSPQTDRRAVLPSSVHEPAAAATAVAAESGASAVNEKAAGPWRARTISDNCRWVPPTDDDGWWERLQMEERMPAMAANIARLPPRERKEFLARQKGKMLATLTLEQRAKRAADAHDRGNEHFRRQSWAEAAFEYHLSLALMPSSATVGSNLAATMLKMKQFKAALEAADAALKLFGDDKLQYAELSVRKKLIRRRELALSGLQQSTTVMEEPAIETVQAQELAGAQRQNRASLLARGNDADSSETSLSAPV
jgi:hypothetical protein